ncbi:MAG TPA: DUF72 domain-containing protein [Candidatus Aquilonibacter sp.]|nr:DUF72 domain-containing protein [Candidatus Aquilonibacter sp.]
MPLARSTPSHRSVTRIGTAGWTLPKQHAKYFPDSGTHLQRCAQGFTCLEVNSSFHRPHRRETWARWADCTPPSFRFSVKLPKTITHEAGLRSCGAALQTFFEQVSGLGEKLGPVLVQLPPKLSFDDTTARDFFTTLRELHSGLVALEPRHASWFARDVSRLLVEFSVARVAADPPKGSPLAASPGGWPGLCYWRLHGTPRTYYSSYDASFLAGLAQQLRENSCAERWIIFDNTALGHATENALQLMRELRNNASALSV